jgi:Uma2 family endonuclease
MITPPVEADLRWTIHDLEGYDLEEGQRYEIIAGALYVTTQPHWTHQDVCTTLAAELWLWTRQGGHGSVVLAPGVVFDLENAVAPDLVWVSAERLPVILGEDGKLHDAPDLVVEVLSPGSTNTRRDRELKLRLYSVRGVREYWIVDWPAKSLQVFRREAAALKLVATLVADDELTSPLLPGFSLPIARLFPD